MPLAVDGGGDEAAMNRLTRGNGHTRERIAPPCRDELGASSPTRDLTTLPG